MRLGEMLVERGLLAADKLVGALRAQVVHGARLGTNLLDLEAVNIRNLGEVLADQRKTPLASERDFANADPGLRARLPAEYAAQKKLVPLATDERGVVLVAGLDPLPAELQEELAGFFGGPVEGRVAPEVRVLYNLELAYGLPRPNRYLRTGLYDVQAQATVAKQESRPPEGTSDRRRYVPTLREAKAEPAEGALGRVALKRVAVQPKKPGAKAAEAPPEQTPPKSVEEALMAMRRANSRDRAGEILIDTIATLFSGELGCAMLMVVRDQLAIGWKGFVAGERQSSFDSIALSLDEPSCFNLPYHLGEPEIGSPRSGGSELDHLLWKHLGAEAPKTTAVYPLTLMGEVRCLLYAHSPAEIRPATSDQLRELLEALGTAFTRLVRALER